MIGKIFSKEARNQSLMTHKEGNNIEYRIWHNFDEEFFIQFYCVTGSSATSNAILGPEELILTCRKLGTGDRWHSIKEDMEKEGGNARLLGISCAIQNTDDRFCMAKPYRKWELMTDFALNYYQVFVGEIDRYYIYTIRVLPTTIFICYRDRTTDLDAGVIGLSKAGYEFNFAVKGHEYDCIIASRECTGYSCSNFAIRNNAEERSDRSWRVHFSNLPNDRYQLVRSYIFDQKLTTEKNPLSPQQIL